MYSFCQNRVIFVFAGIYLGGGDGMNRALSFVSRLLFPEVDDEPPVETASVEDELSELSHKIAAASSRFDFALSDGEIETAIYDLNALERRYRLLIEQKKRRDAP